MGAGKVSTGEDLAVEVPEHLQADLGGLQLVAFALAGSGSASTGELVVAPGDRVEWALENNLALSSVFLRRGAGTQE